MAKRLHTDIKIIMSTTHMEKIMVAKISELLPFAFAFAFPE